MNKLLAFSLTFFILNFSFAQRIKTPQKAIDNEIYSVGDIIQIKSPTNNGKFQTIIYANRTSFSDVLNTVSTGSTIGTTSIKSQFADSNIKNFNGKISFFKLEELGNNKVTVAYIPYTSEVFLKIYLDNAISIGEVKSKNPNYKTIKSRDNSIDDNQVIAFNNDFDIEIIGAFGNLKNHTVTVEFTVENKLDLAQIVDINYAGDRIDSRGDSFATDFDGNTYRTKETKFGNNSGYSSYRISQEIPSNIKIKCAITYENILTDITKFSVIVIKMSSKNSDSYNSDQIFGTTYLRNVPIKWTSYEITQENYEKVNSIKFENEKSKLETNIVKENQKNDMFEGNYESLNQPNSVHINIGLDNEDKALFYIKKINETEYEIGDNYVKNIYQKKENKLVRSTFFQKIEYFFIYDKESKRDILVIKYDDNPINKENYYIKSKKSM